MLCGWRIAVSLAKGNHSHSEARSANIISELKISDKKARADADIKGSRNATTRLLSRWPARHRQRVTPPNLS